MQDTVHNLYMNLTAFYSERVREEKDRVRERKREALSDECYFYLFQQPNPRRKTLTTLEP